MKVFEVIYSDLSGSLDSQTIKIYDLSLTDAFQKALRYEITLIGLTLVSFKYLGDC